MPGGSVATIKDWTINTVTFDQGATLIKNPTGKTMAGTFSMSAIAFNTPTLTSGNLFLFAGTYTYNPTDSYGFSIDNIDIDDGSLAGAGNMFISLTGSFVELEVNDILLNDVTCDDMSLVHLAPTQVTNDAKLSSWTVTNSTLDNSFKLMKYASTGNAAKIDISTITLNGGT